MDKVSEAIFNAKAKQIDIEPQQELIKIDEEYAQRGLPGSGMYLRARGLAEIKAQARKDEVENKENKHWWQKVYHAARGLNEIVGKATSAYDLLLCPTTKQVQVNPKYIK